MDVSTVSSDKLKKHKWDKEFKLFLRKPDSLARLNQTANLKTKRMDSRVHLNFH